MRGHDIPQTNLFSFVDGRRPRPKRGHAPITPDPILHERCRSRAILTRSNECMSTVPRPRFRGFLSTFSVSTFSDGPRSPTFSVVSDCSFHDKVLYDPAGGNDARNASARPDFVRGAIPRWLFIRVPSNSRTRVGHCSERSGCRWGTNHHHFHIQRYELSNRAEIKGRIPGGRSAPT